MNTHHKISLVAAILVPGVAQILRKNPRVLDGLLFLLGLGALLGIMFFLLFLPFHAEPLEHFVGLSVFDPVDIYPLSFKTSLAMPETMIPMHADDQPLLVRQPHFWKLLLAYTGLYVICATLSGWDVWKAVSTKQPAAGSRQPERER